MKIAGKNRRQKSCPDASHELSSALHSWKELKERMSTQAHTFSNDNWRFYWESYREEFAQLAMLEERIHYPFCNRDLLYEAMIHRSSLNQLASDTNSGRLPWNERLEFLGDSVLGLIVSSMLWKTKRFDEGQLSQWKASLVSEASLAKLAQELGLHRCLSVGKVERKSGHHLRPSLLADALEALIGAIYLDSSFDTVAKLVSSWFEEYFPLDQDDAQDPKTRLQELYQERYQKVPNYLTIEEWGPDHLKHFRVAVEFDGQRLAEGEGTSKKRASQEAAKRALQQLLHASEVTVTSSEVTVTSSEVTVTSSEVERYAMRS